MSFIAFDIDLLWLSVSFTPYKREEHKSMKFSNSIIREAGWKDLIGTQCHAALGELTIPFH